MKSKERPRALTKEGPTHEVKKDHGGRKAQKEGKRKKKSKKEKDPDLGHEWDLHQPGSGPLRESVGDPKKDMDGFEDLEKDVGDPEDRTSHS